MSTQGRSRTRTNPPEMVASASITGRRKVITPDERAPIEIELSVVPTVDGGPSPSAVLSLELVSGSPEALRLADALEPFIADLRGRRPNERVTMRVDLERIMNG